MRRIWDRNTAVPVSGMMLKLVSVATEKANIGQIFGVLMIRVKNGVMIAYINNLFAKKSLHNNNVI